MQAFQPPGFRQSTFPTPDGPLLYTEPDPQFWGESEARTDQSALARSPLVFLHSLGGGSSAYEWSQVFPAFGATHRTIAPDLIGWGDSAHPTRTYYPQDYLDQIQLLLEQVAGSPTWVVASSLTAALTIRLATQQPHLFQGLFLVCPSGYRDLGTGDEREWSAQIFGLPGVDRLLYTFGAANEWAVRQFLETFLFAERSRLSEETVAAYLASATRPNADYAALASLQGNLYFNLADYMKDLAVPTVLVWGEQARLSRLAQGQRLAQLNPKAIRAFHTIPGAGTLAQLEQPALVTGLLRQAIAS